MMEKLPLTVLYTISKHLPIYKINKLICTNRTLNTQFIEILQKTRYLQINGDFFHDKIFIRLPEKHKPFFFTKILNISRYSFCTGFVKFYNFTEPEFKYRYEFHNHMIEKNQKGTHMFNAKTFLEYPLQINSLVIKMKNKVTIKIKIFTR